MIEIELKGLPPLNSADNLSWRAKRAIKNRWLNAVAYAVRQVRGPGPHQPWQKATVTITRCSSAEPDGDNLAHGAKFLLDGLKMARVIEDDKPAVIGRPVFAWEYAPRSAGCVRIRVEPVESALAGESASGG